MYKKVDMTLNAALIEIFDRYLEYGEKDKTGYYNVKERLMSLIKMTQPDLVQGLFNTLNKQKYDKFREFVKKCVKETIKNNKLINDKLICIDKILNDNL